MSGILNGRGQLSRMHFVVVNSVLRTQGEAQTDIMYTAEREADMSDDSDEVLECRGKIVLNEQAGIIVQCICIDMTAHLSTSMYSL